MKPGMAVVRRRSAAFIRSLFQCGVVAAAAFTLHPAVAQEWKPNRNVDIVVNSGAGGAADRQARVVQKFLQSVPGMPSITVTNRAGGGGLLALTFIAQRPGDAHYLGVLSTSVLTNQIVGVSKIGYQDVTPVNILMREYVVAWVKADSPLASAKDLVARLRRDPSSVAFGFSSALGNQNHVVIGMIAKAVQVAPKGLKTVVFSSGGAGMTAALGGHVDVWVGTPGSAVPHLQSGAARVLGISSAQRQPGSLATMPTLREQGIDAVYYAWRGFLAPKGLTAAQIAFWDQVFTRLANSDEWKKDLDENGWAEGFLASADARKHLDAEYEMLARMLAELGLVKR